MYPAATSLLFMEIIMSVDRKKLVDALSLKIEDGVLKASVDITYENQLPPGLVPALEQTLAAKNPTSWRIEDQTQFAIVNRAFEAIETHIDSLLIKEGTVV